MDLSTITKYQDIVVEKAIGYAPKIATALIVLIVGLWAAGLFTRLIRRGLQARKVDPTLTPFVCNLVGWGLKALVIISVASSLGVQTTSFVAVLGAAGLAVGLALQGSLSNFAGGVLILIFRPYKVGDLIEAQGEIGVVEEIQIFTTIVTSPENRRVIIPNGALSNGTIRNYSAEDVVRVDTTVGVSYEADLSAVKKVLMEKIQSLPGVVQDPAPVVAVSELGDSSVNLVVRPYARPADYWDVYFATVEGSKLALDAAGISIPFPQRDVHLIEKK